MDIICLQETKMQEMNTKMVRSLGVGRFLDWTALNVDGSAGGILLIWDKRRISLVDSLVGNFSEWKIKVPFRQICSLLRLGESL